MCCWLGSAGTVEKGRLPVPRLPFLTVENDAICVVMNFLVINSPNGKVYRPTRMYKSAFRAE